MKKYGVRTFSVVKVFMKSLKVMNPFFQVQIVEQRKEERVKSVKADSLIKNMRIQKFKQR
jgi:hypothetical protein